MMGLWWVVWIGLAPQQSPAHEVRMAVSDVRASVEWYSSALGFDVVSEDHFENGSSLAVLNSGSARLVLESARGGARSAVIKVGLLVPDIDAVAARVRDVAGESLLGDVDDLPPSELDGWPRRYFMAVDPDGTLVQGLGRPESLAGAQWLLAAVNVASLDDAAAWYSESVRFEEVARPTFGDPRNLMRRGTFYLELGEFGSEVVEGMATAGVTRLLFDSDRPERACTWVDAVEGFRLRYCAFSRAVGTSP